MDEIYGCKWYVKCIQNIYKPDGILLVFDSFSIGCIGQDDMIKRVAGNVGDHEPDGPGDDEDDEESGIGLVVVIAGDEMMMMIIMIMIMMMMIYKKE